MNDSLTPERRAYENGWEDARMGFKFPIEELDAEFGDYIAEYDRGWNDYRQHALDLGLDITADH